ncbi:hypothetical protein LUZ60_017667 [Juncus effusus]|nr:hypothetical protein LUZ60_017667 [Juncus effusus]
MSLFPIVGLPFGVENLSTASEHDSWRVDEASKLSRPELELLIRAYKPDAIISDIHFTWTTNIGLELSIPRFTFYPIGIFPQIILNKLFEIRSDIIKQKKQDPYQCFGNVPNLPGPEIIIPPSELPDLLVKDDFLAGISDEVLQARVNGSGAIVNTFYDLEFDYYDHYKIMDPNAYFVGPLGLSTSNDNNGATQRGGKGDMACLHWLNSKDERSVVFICFGSWCHFNKEQLREMALGLENSGENFLWILRGGKDIKEDEWMPEGWEKRVEPRRLVVRGWAPQLSILKHVSVSDTLWMELSSGSSNNWDTHADLATSVRAVHNRETGCGGEGMWS